MGKSFRFLLPALLFIAPLRTIARDLVIPAGALLQCTISDPQFSSKTAELDDPLVCQLHSGRWLLPAGTFLAGRFEEYRDPGHFVGKGWMYLKFDRIVLSDRVVPLSARVVYASGLPVDRKGRIHGRGHPVRDLAEWSIPVLWPVKVATLPMRGPRPTLKSETRLMLKVMDDVIVPGVPEANGFTEPAGHSWADKIWRHDSSMLRNPDPHPPLGISPSAVERSVPLSAPLLDAFASRGQVNQESTPTILILKDGRLYVATDYWFEGGQRIRFVPVAGVQKAIAIENLDYARTVEMNRQRGVTFEIRSKRIRGK